MSENAKDFSVHEQPAPPAVDTSSHEFQAAVEAATKAALDKALPSILKSLAGGNSPQIGAAIEGDAAQQMFRGLALAIAEISDQGTSRKRVAPEILASRQEAHSRMVEAILHHKRTYDEAMSSAHTERDREEANKARPFYRAITKLCLNERLIDPYKMVNGKPEPVKFRWSGVPSEGMRPENEAAKEIFQHFLDSIGSVVKEKAQTPIWVTAGGLSIVGEGPQRRQIASVADFDDDLDLTDNDNPGNEFVNVLGTIQAPARRNNQDARKAI
jgi:hypothetical protein